MTEEFPKGSADKVPDEQTQDEMVAQAAEVAAYFEKRTEAFEKMKPVQARIKQVADLWMARTTPFPELTLKTLFEYVRIDSERERLEYLRPSELADMDLDRVMAEVNTLEQTINAFLPGR